MTGFCVDKWTDLRQSRRCIFSTSVRINGEGIMAREYTNNMLIWIGGIFLLAGIPILCAGFWFAGDAANQKRLDKEGQPAQGIVLTKTTSTSSSSRSATSTTSYYITYRFKTSAGQVLRGKSRVSRVTWDRLVEREPVDVQYLADAPEVSRISGADRDGFTALLFAGLGGMACLIGIAVFPVGIRQAYTARRLLSQGLLAAATVEKVAEANASFNGVAQWWVYYRYIDPQGQTWNGRSGYLPPEEASSWHPGDMGWARFDPQRPKKSIWIGKQ
jgi:hypothetical protein